MKKPALTTPDFRSIINDEMRDQFLTKTELAARMADMPENRRTSLAQIRMYLNGHTSISADRLEVILAVLSLKVMTAPASPDSPCSQE